MDIVQYKPNPLAFLLGAILGLALTFLLLKLL